MAAVLALGLASCGGSGDKPQTLPPLSQAPSTTPPTSPAPDPKAAAAAIVRSYYRLLNARSTVANADALAQLMTNDCPCMRLVRATRSVARKSQHYFGKNHVVSVTPSLDSPHVAEALVQYDYTAGGIKDDSGTVISRTQGRKGNLVRFLLALHDDKWLISRIDVLKSGRPA